MKRNVDLTLNREFDKIGLMISKGLYCEACGNPKQTPWKYYCLKCERFFNSIIFRKSKYSEQLNDGRTSAIKLSIHAQFRDDRWYYSKDLKLKCCVQLGKDKFTLRKRCREQIGS